MVEVIHRSQELRGLNMELLVVGDVHGCFHTFTKLINEHWNSDKQILDEISTEL